MKRAAAVVAVAAVAAACGAPPPEFGDIDAGACMEYMVPQTEDLSTPTVSFANDVMPVLTSHCAQCHGTQNSPSGNLFLGKSSSDAATVYTGIVGIASGELQTMNFVTVPDPAHSFLMLKLDGDQCMYNGMCAGGSCDEAMPQTGGQLDSDDRDKIRRWIYQGAMND
ncbi:MAG TPA: hypothetical protein VH143_26720 [Kofleriaceae bacterium]|nr:hypothetical protein [Kofleriaceae bacterium]